MWLHRGAGGRHTDKGGDAQTAQGSGRTPQGVGTRPGTTISKPHPSDATGHTQPPPSPARPPSHRAHSRHHQPQPDLPSTGNPCPPRPPGTQGLVLRVSAHTHLLCEASPPLLSQQIPPPCSQSSRASPPRALITLNFNQLLSAFPLYFSTRFLQRLHLT